ncbi:MAG: FAD binding domain-containing protein, partial [Deltaproteobacteria bacterium]|nr:FAD binding domain-containing protein [Deltaproteobacteria bacterium]
MKTIKRFKHVNAGTVEEAASILKEGNASIIAGGTDILGTMRFEILPDYPEILVNLKTIPGMDYIKEEAGMLKIGALTRLEDIAKSGVVRTGYTALAQAAHRTASPHIREMGTIGGNICQLTRCWYFRNPDNRFNCIRKGGKKCYAITGENRYHSIFGAVKGCMAVNPSDTAPALVALNAKIKTSKRLIDAQDFWDAVKPGSTILAADEIVTEIQVPTPARGVRSSFMKFAIRSSIDFPIVNCAAMIGKGNARICLNAVHNMPYRVDSAESLIKGKSINEKNADA